MTQMDMGKETIETKGYRFLLLDAFQFIGISNVTEFQTTEA
jgi:hypothetical protein